MFTAALALVLFTAGCAVTSPGALAPQAAPTLAASGGETKTSNDKLQAPLAQLVDAFHSGDPAKLATLGGDTTIDLQNNTVRVILEMENSPDAHPVGGSRIETATLPDGRTVQIDHGPAIAIRPDLAQAIATTGATYETAYGNWVQVLAPFSSLEALARIPDVRLVRLPYPAQH